MGLAAIAALITIALLVIARAYTIGDVSARTMARAEYDRVKEGAPSDPLVQMDQEAFLRIFDKVRRKRFWVYFFVFVVLATLASIILMMVMGLVWRYIDPGLYVWGFITFFAYIAVGILCLLYTLHLYTKNLWPAMREAVRRATKN
jgi:hypothetical protein